VSKYYISKRTSGLDTHLTIGIPAKRKLTYQSYEVSQDKYFSKEVFIKPDE